MYQIWICVPARVVSGEFFYNNLFVFGQIETSLNEQNYFEADSYIKCKKTEQAKIS